MSYDFDFTDPVYTAASTTDEKKPHFGVGAIGRRCLPKMYRDTPHVSSLEADQVTMRADGLNYTVTAPFLKLTDYTPIHIGLDGVTVAYPFVSSADRQAVVRKNGLSGYYLNREPIIRLRMARDAKVTGYLLKAEHVMRQALSVHDPDAILDPFYVVDEKNPSWVSVDLSILGWREDIKGPCDTKEVVSKTGGKYNVVKEIKWLARQCDAGVPNWKPRETRFFLLDDWTSDDNEPVATLPIIKELVDYIDNPETVDSSKHVVVGPQHCTPKHSISPIITWNRAIRKMVNGRVHYRMPLVCVLAGITQPGDYKPDETVIVRAPSSEREDSSPFALALAAFHDHEDKQKKVDATKVGLGDFLARQPVSGVKRARSNASVDEGLRLAEEERRLLGEIPS